MADILSNSVSGLLSVQRALATTGHNVSNANVEGYSRQRVEMSAQMPQFMGNGYVGTGTKVDSITRNFDQFVESQLRDATSENSRLGFLQDFASQVTGVLGDTETGVSQASQAFFNAAGDVASNPTDITSRQAFLNEAGALTDRLNRVDIQLAQLNANVGRQAGSITQEINVFAGEVADLNDKITTAYAQDPSALPNDLLDRRDQLVRDIANRINIRVDDDGKGSLNLAVGSGQSLVTGSVHTDLSATAVPSGVEIEIDGKSITRLVTGGDLGGIVEAQSTLITPLRNQLGRTAMVVAQEVNAIQTQGFDLDGNAGEPLFSLAMEGSVIGSPRNEGNGGATADVTDATLLKDERYIARYDSTQSEWVIRSEKDPGSILAQVAVNGSTTAIPGLDITFDSTPVHGDALYIDSGVGAASRISTRLSDPSDVAAAGSADDGAGGTVTLGSRDNTNIQRITDLANQSVVGQSTSDYNGSLDPDALDGQTIGGSLASAVGQAGSVARSAELQGASSQAALDNLQARKESISGVNLDEEAAKLLQYQQQYQALARSISISGQLFQSVLNAVR
ncbi:flagellar hook-associated protein FlgK [Guyparkeria sp. GHLCS8-2]|uniref:flagellar hook-associated protein FlgK n=1 Tax=Guyparkeria halopsychrophila TaxID=3139421 RepID=UPI0037C67FFC